MKRLFERLSKAIKSHSATMRRPNKARLAVESLEDRLRNRDVPSNTEILPQSPHIQNRIHVY
jgi:hypothetical protein